MARGTHWWGEPPLWAWIVMGVAAVAIAVMLPFALDREPPGASMRTAPVPEGTAGGTGPAPATDPASPTADGDGAGTADPAEARVLVVGDGYAAGTAQGGVGAQGWPALVGDRLGIDVDVAAEVGAGYVTPGVNGSTFPDLAGDGSPGADLVVLTGGRDDGAVFDGQVAAAAEALYGRLTAGGAELVVLGPVLPDLPDAGTVDARRAALEAQAEAAGARFVDPVGEGWFTERPELLGADGVYPTDAGHAYLADLLAPVLADALDDPAAG